MKGKILNWKTRLTLGVVLAFLLAFGAGYAVSASGGGIATISFNHVGDGDVIAAGELTLTAPEAIEPGHNFLYWLVNGEQVDGQTITVDMSTVGSVQAIYNPVYCNLAVQAPSGTSVYIYKGTTQVAAGTVGTSKEKIFQLSPDTYNVKLKQGAVYTNFNSFNCSAGAPKLDGLEQLTIDAPNGTSVYILNTSNQQATAGTVGTSKTKTFDVVPRNDYRIKYKQGAVYTTFSPINCSVGSGVCSHDGLEELTVDAPNGTSVYILNPSNQQATAGTVGTSKTKTFDVVPRNDYKVKFKQGAVYAEFTGIDCSTGACSQDGLETMTVQAPNGTSVYIYDFGDHQATSGTVGTSKTKTFDVVPRDDYKVKYKQGAVYTTFSPINCNSVATCNHVGLSELTVQAPNGTSVYIYDVDNHQATSGTVGTSKSKKFDVVPRDDYKIKYKQGAAYTTFSPINCSGATCSHIALCAITVKAPNGTALYVYKESNQATSGTVGTSQLKTLDVVRYNDYQVKLKYSGIYYNFYNVDAESSCPADLTKSEMTVKFPDMKLNRVTIKNQSGGTVTYKDWPQDEWTFNLDYGTYDVVLQHGAKTKTVEDVFVLGQVTVDGIVSEATVHFEGIKLNRATVQTTTTGGTVTYKDWPQDTYTVPLLKNTYDVLLQQGAATKTVALNATGDTASVPRDDVVCDLTVKFPDMKLNRVTIKTPSGGTVTYTDWPQDEWVVPLLQNEDYTVELQHGAKIKTVENVDCSGTSQTVDGIVSEATVHFEGMKLNRATVQTTTTGGTVTYKDWPQDTYTVPLLKNTYDVLLQQGAATRTVALDATGDTASVPRDAVVCDLTVEFPEMKLNRVTIKTPSGGTVTYTDWPQDEWVVPLLQNDDYTVELQHGAKVKTVTGVVCSGTTQTVNNIVATLTVDFPGYKPNRVTIKTTTGGTVTYKDWPQDQVIFKLLKNHYTVEINVGGKVGSADVNCTGNTCSLAESQFKVNAPAGTSVQIKHYTSGAVIANGTVASNQWITFSNLPIGIYDVVLTQGTHSVTVEDYFHIGGTTLDMLNVLKVNAPAGTQVQVKKSGGVVTSGNVASNQWATLYVIKDNYDLFLKQNAEEKTTGVDSTGDDTSVDELSILKVNAPAGTKVKTSVPDTTDEVTSGTVASNQWVTLYVVKDTYDIYLEQNTGTKTIEDQDVNDDKTIDELCVLTVNAPAGTVVKVLEAGVVTNGTVASDQWVTLYVVKDSYAIELTQGAEVKTIATFDCTGETATTDQLAELRVNAPSNTAVLVQTGSGAVTSGNIASNQWVTLYVVKDTYDLKLTQNAEVKNVASVDCTGDLIIEDHLSVLRVNAPAGTQVKAYVPNNMDTVTSGTVASNQWVTLYVVSDIYDVYLEQNAGQKTLEDQNVSSDLDLSELCTLKVNTTPGTLIQVFVPGGTNLVTSGTVASNQWVTLYVVRGTYDVFDGMTTKSVNCSGATASEVFP